MNKLIEVLNEIEIEDLIYEDIGSKISLTKEQIKEGCKITVNKERNCIYFEYSCNFFVSDLVIKNIAERISDSRVISYGRGIVIYNVSDLLTLYGLFKICQ